MGRKLSAGGLAGAGVLVSVTESAWSGFAMSWATVRAGGRRGCVVPPVVLPSSLPTVLRVASRLPLSVLLAGIGLAWFAVAWLSPVHAQSESVSGPVVDTVALATPLRSAEPAGSGGDGNGGGGGGGGGEHDGSGNARSKDSSGGNSSGKSGGSKSDKGPGEDQTGKAAGQSDKGNPDGQNGGQSGGTPRERGPDEQQADNAASNSDRNPGNARTGHTGQPASQRTGQQPDREQTDAAARTRQNQPGRAGTGEQPQPDRQPVNTATGQPGHPTATQTGAQTEEPQTFAARPRPTDNAGTTTTGDCGQSGTCTAQTANLTRPQDGEHQATGEQTCQAAGGTGCVSPGQAARQGGTGTGPTRTARSTETAIQPQPDQQPPGQSNPGSPATVGNGGQTGNAGAPTAATGQQANAGQADARNASAEPDSAQRTDNRPQDTLAGADPPTPGTNATNANLTHSPGATTTRAVTAGAQPNTTANRGSTATTATARNASLAVPQRRPNEQATSDSPAVNNPQAPVPCGAGTCPGTPPGQQPGAAPSTNPATNSAESPEPQDDRARELGNLILRPDLANPGRGEQPGDGDQKPELPTAPAPPGTSNLTNPNGGTGQAGGTNHNSATNPDQELDDAERARQALNRTTTPQPNDPRTSPRQPRASPKSLSPLIDPDRGSDTSPNLGGGKPSTTDPIAGILAPYKDPGKPSLLPTPGEPGSSSRGEPRPSSGELPGSGLSTEQLEDYAKQYLGGEEGLSPELRESAESSPETVSSFNPDYTDHDRKPTREEVLRARDNLAEVLKNRPRTLDALAPAGPGGSETPERRAQRAAESLIRQQSQVDRGRVTRDPKTEKRLADEDASLDALQAAHNQRVADFRAKGGTAKQAEELNAQARDLDQRRDALLTERINTDVSAIKKYQEVAGRARELFGNEGMRRLVTAGGLPVHEAVHRIAQQGDPSGVRDLFGKLGLDMPGFDRLNNPRTKADHDAAEALKDILASGNGLDSYTAGFSPQDRAELDSYIRDNKIDLLLRGGEQAAQQIRQDRGKPHSWQGGWLDTPIVNNAADDLNEIVSGTLAGLPRHASDLAAEWGNTGKGQAHTAQDAMWGHLASGLDLTDHRLGGETDQQASRRLFPFSHEYVDSLKEYGASLANRWKSPFTEGGKQLGKDYYERPLQTVLEDANVVLMATGAGGLVKSIIRPRVNAHRVASLAQRLDGQVPAHRAAFADDLDLTKKQRAGLPELLASHPDYATFRAHDRDFVRRLHPRWTGATNHKAGFAGEPDPALAAGHSSRFGEESVTRDRGGLITHVGGMPVERAANDLVDKHAARIMDLEASGTLRRGDIGPNVSIMVDLRTGDFVPYVNGRTSLAAGSVHPVMGERYGVLRADGPYPQFDRRTGEPLTKNGRLVSSDFPYMADPLRHAEMKGVNELLWRRGKHTDAATLNEFLIVNRHLDWRKRTWTPIPNCANCHRMTEGATSLSGRSTHPPGHPDRRLLEDSVGGRQRDVTGFPSAGEIQNKHGMPAKDQRAFQRFADRLGLTITVRPSSLFSLADRLAGTGIPKTKDIKNKTINEYDEILDPQLKGQRGRVGSFNPREPVRGNLSDQDWTALRARHQQRLEEYADQEQNLDRLVADGKVKVDGGVVYGKDKHGEWKPYVADNDMFDIRKTDTGERLTREEEKELIRKMLDEDMGVEHGPHMYWKPNNTVEQGIYDRIVHNHRSGGEPLIRFSPNSPPTLVDGTGDPLQ
ncbi:hypothetical protein GCM10023321_74690 [Pseudonocardia eucalypti]|uniref:Tox-PL domain-containing protein n=1 Tax=Pseudonocardia eucalypti TaxID=648755 RepID=A0ABP9RA24_9PSEU